MINTTTIIILILATIGFVLTWSLLKNLLKATVTAFFIMLIGTIILGGVAYIDYSKLKDYTSQEVNMNIYHNEKLMTTLNIDFKEKIVSVGEVNSSMQINANASNLIQNQTIKLSRFNSNITRETLNQILDMQTKNEIMTKLPINNQETFNSKEELKEDIILNIVTQIVTTKNNLELIRYSVNANMTTEPEFTTIKLINNIPNIITKRII
ncbi:MAG: hypothetical protein ACMXX7_03065 [Candidatus Woesearchaeota archaeon]